MRTPSARLPWPALLLALLAACDGGTPTGPAVEPSSNPALAIGGTPGKVTDQIEIRLEVQPDDGLDIGFAFTGDKRTNLKLDDDADPILPNFKVMPSLKAGTYSVVMNALPTGFRLTSITCISFPNGGSGGSDDSFSLPARSVSIRLQRLERVVCTFVVARYFPLTVTIDQAAGQADPASGAFPVPVTFHVVFSNPVADIPADALAFSGVPLAGGSLAPTGARDGTEYLFTVFAGDTGTLTASVLAGRVTDIYGQTNAASTSTDNSVEVEAGIQTGCDPSPCTGS
jgi:hypothetical protein